MKRNKRLFVWILAAMLLFSQLLVYASEPGREKETGRVEEKVHTEKTVQEEPEDEKKETESEPERIRIEAEHVNVSIQTKTIKTEEWCCIIILDTSASRIYKKISGMEVVKWHRKKFMTRNLKFRL